MRVGNVSDIGSVGRRVSILVVQVSCPECLADLAPVTVPPTRINITSAVMIANEAGRLVNCPECQTALVLTQQAVLSVLIEQPDGTDLLRSQVENR
jgi:hypothetical protein